MVRLKHRYLTIHILYPSVSSTSDQSSSAYILNLHRPTPLSIFQHSANPSKPSPAVDNNAPAQHLIRLIRASISYIYGSHGSGLVSPSLKVVYFSPATSTAIIRVARKYFRIVWAAITYLTSWDESDIAPTAKRGGADVKRKKDGASEGMQCVFRVVRVCGTIKMAEADVVRRAKEEIKRVRIMGSSSAWADGLGVEEHAEVGNEVVDALSGKEQKGKVKVEHGKMGMDMDMDEIFGSGSDVTDEDDKG